MSGAAVAVEVVASPSAGRRVLAGRMPEACCGSPLQTLLFSGTATALGKGSVDEELHIQGNSVVWTAGGVLRKQLTVPAPVLKAAWCIFQNTGPDAILCLLQLGVLSVHTQDGDSHTIPLPGSFTGLWPLPQGVLLTGAAAQGPCILAHPLENIQEVQMQPAAAGAAASGSSSGWDTQEQVVWSGVEVPYIVTHNTRHQRLAVWSIGTQQAQGFVAVTPMRWPGGGAPLTPGTQAPAGIAPLPPGMAVETSSAQLTTPVPRTVGGAGGGTYKK